MALKKDRILIIEQVRTLELSNQIQKYHKKWRTSQQIS